MLKFASRLWTKSWCCSFHFFLPRCQLALGVNMQIQGGHQVEGGELQPFLSLVEAKALKYGSLKRPMFSSQKELWISVSGRFR